MTLPPASMAPVELRDHAQELLTAIVDDVGELQTAPKQMRKSTGLGIKRGMAPSGHLARTVFLFGLELRLNEHPNRVPDRLRRRVAEHPFRRRVPGGDDAVEILAIIASSDDSMTAAKQRPAVSDR
jgi:hypothetical protein